MPSGKRSKAARRAAAAAPPPVRRRSQRARTASPRVLLAAAGVVAAIVVAVVLAIVFTRGSSESSAEKVAEVGSLVNAVPGAANVDALFRGVPQHGTTLGSPAAPATLTEYVDLQCPYCREFETQLLPTIVRKYVRTGKLKIVLRAWAFIGPDSVRGQAAVLAAARQNRAFNYAELLYDNQGTENTGWLNDAIVTAAASSIPGLRVQDLLDDMDSPAVKSAQTQVDRLASRDGVKSTPTLFVGGSGTRGTLVALKSPTDARTLERAIAAALRS